MIDDAADVYERLKLCVLCALDTHIHMPSGKSVRYNTLSISSSYIR